MSDSLDDDARLVETLVEMTAAQYAAYAMSRRASQDEGELAELVAYLLRSPSPRVVVEVGVMHGGTLSLWRRLWPNAELVGIDFLADADAYSVVHELDAHLIRGDSRHPTTAMLLAEYLDGRAIELLHIDGGHDPETFRSDWETYVPMVEAGGGLVLVHDIAYRTLVDEWKRIRESEPLAFTISHFPDRLGFGVLPL